MVECSTRLEGLQAGASPEALHCFPEQDTYPLPSTSVTQEDPSLRDRKFVDWGLKKKYPQHTRLNGSHVGSILAYCPRGCNMGILAHVKPTYGT